MREKTYNQEYVPGKVFIHFWKRDQEFYRQANILKGQYHKQFYKKCE